MMIETRLPVGIVANPNRVSGSPLRVKTLRATLLLSTSPTTAHWRRPPREADRVLSSTGSTIVRDPCPADVERVALEMLGAVDGDLLAADILETPTDAYALEINHNFDAHGGSEPAAAAFRHEIQTQLCALLQAIRAKFDRLGSS